MFKNQKGFTLIELAVCCFGLVGVCVVIGVIYTAVHFAAKYW